MYERVNEGATYDGRTESLWTRGSLLVEAIGNEMNSAETGFDITLHIPRRIVDAMRDEFSKDMGEASFMEAVAVLSETPRLKVTIDNKGRQSIEVKVDLGKVGMRENSFRIFKLIIERNKPPKYYEVAEEPLYEPSGLKHIPLQIVDGSKAKMGQLRDFDLLLGYVLEVEHAS